jgi:glucosyl-dolichyl phosphate glucuronosyltransferase
MLPDVRVTVAIPTWNRAGLLARTLSSLTELRLPSGLDWELLVVNNNSTDNTEDMLASFRGRLPIQSVFEPSPGVAHARNRAAAAATGSYIVWADDDVLVARDWLKEYVAAFRQRPAAVLFGGPILPAFEGDNPPEWLRRGFPAVQSAFGARDMGERPLRLEVEGDRIPYGANYAIRSTTQRVFRYDPDLGRSPQRVWSGGEEWEVFRAVLGSGGEGWWVPHAQVQHHVPRSYQTVGYLRRYYVAQGRYEVRVRPPHGTRLFGKPRWLWRAVVAAEIAYRWRRLTAPPERWVPELKRAAWAWGQLLEAGRARIARSSLEVW